MSLEGKKIYRYKELDEYLIIKMPLLPLNHLMAEDPETRQDRHSKMNQTVSANVFKSEWFSSRPERVQELFRVCPPWGFYVIKDTNIPVRHYGIIEYADNTLGFHACIAHPNWTEKIVGGIPEDRLERVSWWNEEQLSLIKRNDFPRAFLEPLGFIVFQST